MPCHPAIRAMWKKSTGLIRFDDPIMRSMATNLLSRGRDLGGFIWGDY